MGRPGPARAMAIRVRSPPMPSPESIGRRKGSELFGEAPGVQVCRSRSGAAPMDLDPGQFTEVRHDLLRECVTGDAYVGGMPLRLPDDIARRLVAEGRLPKEALPVRRQKYGNKAIV